MRLQLIMAAVKKGASEMLERVPSAGPLGRNKTSAIRAALHPNSSPVYKTQSETALTAGLRNLSLKNPVNKTQQIKRNISGKTNGGGQVKTLDDVAALLQGDTIQNVVVVAGAGISTPSGIPDFRTPGTGLYDNLQQYQIPYPEAIFDIDYFHQNPRPFFTLAKELYPSGKYRPNYIHYFVRLLHDKGKLLRMYTQNIDGLERLAGLPEEKLVEAHGTFATCTCTVCGNKQPGEAIKEKIFASKLPRCPTRGCMGIIKPDIVFFGEDLPRKFYSYMKDMLQTDLVLVMGTSLEVQPFAGIIDTVRLKVPRVLFNREAVGAFRYGRRAQDLVAEGDLVDRMVKFANLVGWKQDMIDLITREEGEFKVAFKPPALVADQQVVPRKKINHKPPPPPRSNHRRNYSSLAYKAQFQGRSSYLSSSEESSDSESDYSSSDSSDDGGRKNQKAKNRTFQRRGNVPNHMGKYKPLQRCLSAKADNVRRVHTDSSQQNGKDINGNITGRSIKSESGKNPNLSTNRIEPQKSNTKAKPNSVAKTPGSNGNVTKEERDRVLRKYGLSPGPKILSSEKNDEPAKPPKKNETAFESNFDTAVTSENIDNGSVEKTDLKQVKSDNSLIGANFIEEVGQEIQESWTPNVDDMSAANSKYAEKTKPANRVKPKETNGRSKNVTGNKNGVKSKVTNVQSKDEISVLNKSESAPSRLSLNGSPLVSEELVDKAPIVKDTSKVIPAHDEDRGIFIVVKPEDDISSDSKAFDVIEAINRKHARLQNDLQRKSVCKLNEIPKTVSDSDLQRSNSCTDTNDADPLKALKEKFSKIESIAENAKHNLLGNRAFLAERNEIIQVPFGHSGSNEDMAHMNLTGNNESDTGDAKNRKKKQIKSKSLREPRSSSQNSAYETYVQAKSVYSEGHIRSRSETKTLSQKAAESFAKYASLSKKNGRDETGLKDLRRHGSGSRTVSKPPSGGRNATQNSELKEVNPRPYGYASRRRAHVGGAGPFRRTNIRTHNGALEYAEAILRSGSAEMPKISYRHKAEPVKVYSVGMFGSLIVKQEVTSPEKEAWVNETAERS